VLPVRELLRTFHRNRVRRVLDEAYGDLASGAARAALRRHARRLVPHGRLTMDLARRRRVLVTGGASGIGRAFGSFGH
jgi:hypothetical protein